MKETPMTSSKLSASLPQRIASLALAGVLFATTLLPTFAVAAPSLADGSGDPSLQSATQTVASSGWADGSGDPSLQGQTPQESISPLNPTDPGVDATRIVALPKEETVPFEVAGQVIDAAAGLDALPQTALLANPTDSNRDSLVVVESDAENAAALLDEMVASGLYAAVDYDVRAYPVVTYTDAPDDPFYTSNEDDGTWGLRAYPGSQFSSVWALLNNAPGNAQTAPIAVIDTGFDMSNEDKGANIVAGYDFGSGDSNVNPDSGDTDADVFHGTSTAGLIGAATDNGIGITGAAWDNKVSIYKAADSTDAIYLSAVTNSINDVVAKKNAKIISMSLGGDSLPSYMQSAIDAAVAAGILVVASAGNSAQDPGNPVMYPAAYAPVISVGSIDPQGAPSDFSTYNSAVDLAAPGENITVLGLNNEYLIAAGTSYSCPTVAAAAALVWRMVPNLNATQIGSILTATAIDVTTAPAKAGKDVYTGAGALDVLAAVDFAKGLPIEPTISKAQAGNGSVTLSWTHSPYDTTTISKYQVQYRSTAAGSAWKVAATVAGTASSLKVSGLAEGSSYYFRVAAANGSGFGAWSTQKKAAPWARSLKTSKSTLTVKRRKKVALYVATYFGEKTKMTISWKSNHRTKATVTTTGSKAAKKGKGSFSRTALTGTTSIKKGKKLYIKGLKKGTVTITFTSGKVSKKVKVKVK
jgi:hypothetical protein